MKRFKKLWKEYCKKWYKTVRVMHESFLQPLGLYAVSEIPQEQFIGTTDQSKESVEAIMMMSTPFGKSYVSSVKYRIGDERASSSWVYRESLFSDYQHHIVLFAGSDGGKTIDFYYHKEYNSVKHPLKHYNREYINPVEDKEKITEMIRKTGIELDENGEPDYKATEAYCPVYLG